MTITTPPEHLVIGVLALQGAFIEHIHYLERLRPSGHRISAVAVRTPEELARCHALIIPGGESTAITRVAARTEGLLSALTAFVADPTRPCYGTCAGMILMASEVGGGKRKGDGGRWGGMRGLRVWRNLYGGQLESFECPLSIPGLSGEKPFNAIFIRAPAVHSLAAEGDMVGNEVAGREEVGDAGVGGTGPGGKERAQSISVLARLPDECIPGLPPSDSPLGEPDESMVGAVMLRQGCKLVTSFHPELSGDVRIHEYWVEKCILGRE